MQIDLDAIQKVLRYGIIVRNDANEKRLKDLKGEVLAVFITVMNFIFLLNYKFCVVNLCVVVAAAILKWGGFVVLGIWQRSRLLFWYTFAKMVSIY